MAEIRQGTPEDAGILLKMIQELAIFEKAPSEVIVSEAQLAEDLRRKAFECLIAEKDGVPVGVALYYYAYSTWKGQFIHLEDLHVIEEHRRKGYGKMLWKAVAKIAHSKGCPRLEWDVLEWNSNAINMYKTAPIIDMSKGWLRYRLDTDGIHKLAEEL